MAEKARYPQIPAPIWWGMRSALNKTPNATFDEQSMSVQFNVQRAAAKAYLGELTAVGILDEDKRATPLANRWRFDETYAEAVNQIINDTYPEGLIRVAPPAEGDRPKAINWFQQAGLGTGAAGNKAATYFLIGSARPNDASNRTAGKSMDVTTTPTKQASKQVKTVTDKRSKTGDGRSGDDPENGSRVPLNVNVQIHISADAGTEQIEAIFSAMRRYLYAKQDS